MKDVWPRYYILMDRTPMAVDMMTWARAFEDRCREDIDTWRVGLDEITNSCHVSTVFLGLDHNYFGRGEPILFETRVFGGPLDGEMVRYCTYAQAERGHAEIVAQARIACAKVKALADAAGASEK